MTDVALLGEKALRLRRGMGKGMMSYLLNLFAENGCGICFFEASATVPELYTRAMGCKGPGSFTTPASCVVKNRSKAEPGAARPGARNKSTVL